MATLAEASLRHARLVGADLTDIDLTCADLTHADLADAKWPVDSRQADSVKLAVGRQFWPTRDPLGLANGVFSMRLQILSQRRGSESPLAF